MQGGGERGRGKKESGPAKKLATPFWFIMHATRTIKQVKPSWPN